MIYDYKTFPETPRDKYICLRSETRFIWILSPERTDDRACRRRDRIAACLDPVKAEEICTFLNGQLV